MLPIVLWEPSQNLAPGLLDSPLGVAIFALCYHFRGHVIRLRHLSAHMCLPCTLPRTLPH
jgi:hypothetical protein